MARRSIPSASARGLSGGIVRAAMKRCLAWGAVILGAFDSCEHRWKFVRPS